jgi:RND family efflux transporter MFP subunit
MSQKWKRYGLIVGIFTFAIGGASMLGKMKPPPEKKEVAEINVLVEVMSVTAQTVSLSVQSQGTVRPRTETILGSEVSGAIIDVSPKFIAGGVFEKGEVLMRIDPTNYRVDVEQAEALLGQRQIEFDGAAKLRTQGYRAESEYASAAAALASARAALVRAGRNLERTFISLPYAGMVRSKEADLGQYVGIGTRLGVTFATDYAEIRLPLTDRDLAFIDLPSAAAISATGNSSGPSVTIGAEQRGVMTYWQGHIVRSEGVVDEKTRVTYAVAQIEDPYRLHDELDASEALPMGTFVSASIEGKTVKDIVRLPRSVLRGNGQVVVVGEDNLLQIRSVEVLRTDEKYAYILSGITEGESISLTSIENPINGMRVRTEAGTDEPQVGLNDD